MSASKTVAVSLTCDADECDESFVSTDTSGINETRGIARSEGWWSRASDDDDWCPDHTPYSVRAVDEGVEVVEERGVSRATCPECDWSNTYGIRWHLTNAEDSARRGLRAHLGQKHGIND